MRKTYLDNIRWITVVIVVLYHVIYMFNGEVVFGVIGPFYEYQPQDIFQYVVYPWFMLLLFVVSGISARFELNKVIQKEYIRKRARKLLVPSTIGLLVWGWILGYYNMAISGAFEALAAVPKPVLFLIMCVSGTGPLWYIQMLWVYSMLLLIVRKIEKDRLWNFCKRANTVVLFALAVVIYLSAQILNTPLVVVYRFGIYGAGFFIGYFLLSHDEVMGILEQKWMLFCTFALGTSILFVVSFWGEAYPEHVVLDTFICNLFAWFGTLGVLSFMKKWGNFSNSFTRWMQQESWGLYVFHYLTIAVSAWYLKLYVPNLSPLVVYLIVGVSGFGGAFLLNRIISKIPILRWCILGYKRERK